MSGLPMRGRFITLEGGEGAGKTTSMNYLAGLLRGAGNDVVTTREPGGTPLGESLRELLLHRRDQAVCDDAELLLIFAARAQHLHTVIEPALAAGQWVLCDRFTDATYAYQGGGRGVERGRIAALEQWTQGDLRPDLTLLFDLPVATGLARANHRSAPDRFEAEGHAFLEQVRQSYLETARLEPRRVRLIDAARTPQEVEVQLEAVIREFL